MKMFKSPFITRRKHEGIKKSLEKDYIEARLDLKAARSSNRSLEADHKEEIEQLHEQYKDIVRKMARINIEPYRSRQLEDGQWCVVVRFDVSFGLMQASYSPAEAESFRNHIAEAVAHQVKHEIMRNRYLMSPGYSMQMAKECFPSASRDMLDGKDSTSVVSR